MPPRLLVITYHFPPDGAVGGLRWLGLSKYLVRLGWEVHVVTAADVAADAGSFGIRRERVARRRTLNDVYNAMAARRRRRRAGDGAPPPAHSAGDPRVSRESMLTRAMRGVRRAGGAALTFPDEARGWVLPAALTARRLLKRQPFDVVVTSGPPHAAHLAGLLATVGTRVPHIVDLRDPWYGTSPDWPGYPVQSRAFHLLIGQLERVVFAQARHVIVNTEEFAERLQTVRPRAGISRVPNGTDVESLPARTEQLFEDTSIIYAGTLYLERNLSGLLGALASMARERPGGGVGLKLRIAGRIEDPQMRRLRSEIAEHGLSDAVEFCGKVSRAEALDLTRRSHLALVLAQGQPTQIPAKLYECIGLGVPTLVIAESNSATSREARRIGAMVLEPDDARGLQSLLRDLADGRVPVTIAPTAPISYEALAGRMDGILRANGSAR